MASNLLKFHVQSFQTPNPLNEFLQRKTLFSYLPFPRIRHQNLTFFTSNDQFHHHRIPSLSVYSSLSCSSPPSSREEAILQAKTCLSTTLEKPLNNLKLASGKQKKVKQPRFRVEIPVIDESPESLSQLAVDVFKDLSIKRKGSKVKILILWPNPTLRDTASQLFQSQSSNNVDHADISSIKSVDESMLGSADVAVFVGSESSQLGSIKTITESLYPRPAVIFNPKWGYEEESTEYGEKGRFLGSFEVIYSFMGLEVRGILRRRKGVVFKCVRNGVVSGEKWGIHVEEEGGGKMEVVSRFKERPSIGEVENVLYNLMAINSPITKSAKFLKGLVSNVTGKK